MEQDPASPATRDPSLDPAAAAEALALLDRLSVEDERPRGYDRDAWPHWIDADGDCMDACQEVLVAESIERPQLTANGCRVVSGRWHDAYIGETYRDPSDLDMDHMVPWPRFTAQADTTGARSAGRPFPTTLRTAAA